ncbi:MAG TPA: response regulator [Candidatus Acidoferrales bacterium]|nr:response regulator [Candidatus Acidoferrales bacterium]
MASILLIDGNAEEAADALDSLNADGLLTPIHIVGDGPEALNFLFSPSMLDLRHGTQPALILLDLRLPVIDSEDLLQIIKADPRTQMIPTIILTSAPFADAIHRKLKCRADGFLEKPLTFRRLLLAAKAVGIRLAYKNSNIPSETAYIH